MIDSSGYRANLGIILTNHQGQVFLGKRMGQNAWQCPQGGVDLNENLEEGLYRELYEEIGLKAEDVKLLGRTKNWLRYKIPEKLRREATPECIGQKQKWFLLAIEPNCESNIKLDLTDSPEFEDWQWVSYWYPLRAVISFKRGVYRRAFLELQPYLTSYIDKLDKGGSKPLHPLLDPVD